MNEVYLDYLAHHGILGMRWGIRRFQDYGHGGYDPKHKGLFKGRRKGKTSKSVAKKGQTGGKLTEEQKAKIKKAAIVGAAVAGTALATYGTYKVSRYINKKNIAKSIAKSITDSGPTIINKNTGQKFAGDASDILSGVDDAARSVTNNQYKKVLERNGIKSLDRPETIEEALHNANTLSTKEAKNTCVPSAIIGHCRTKYGADLTTKTTNGQMQLTGGVVEECFKGAKIVEGSAVKFGKSRVDAEEMLIKNFGANAEGLCAVDLKNKVTDKINGHAFSWKITDGKVTFMDYRHGLDDAAIEAEDYFNRIVPNGQMTLARLDNAEPVWDEIKKWAQ